MKRNIISTLFEIFFPVILFCLIIILRKSFPIVNMSFEEFDHNLTYFMENKSIISSVDIDDGLDLGKFSPEKIPELIKYINFSKLDFDNIDINNFNFKELDKLVDQLINSIDFDKFDFSDFSLTYLGIPIMIPPLYICSKLNEQKQERPLIASIGIPLEIKWRMIIDSWIFYKFASLAPDDAGPKFDFKLELENFKEFETIEDMERYIKEPDYLTNPDKLICFGMRFFNNETSNEYNYSLHFFDFDKIGKEGVQDIPSDSQGMFDQFQSGPDIISYMRYTNGAYNYMMKLVNEYILKKETGKSEATFSYGVFPMKFTDFRVDQFGQFFGYIITIIIVVAYMSPISLYVYRMVKEKESRTKEGMKIMGLGEGEYFLSYFIQYVIISLFISLINTYLFSIVFTGVPLYYLYLLIFLFSLDVFALIYFFQSFIDKTRISIVLSLVIYFIMLCTSLPCLFEKTSYLIKQILSVFPAVSLNLGIILLSKFEYHFRKFYDRDLMINYINYSLFNMYVMFVVDFFLYLFLGYYLHNVLPHDFGIRKPWYFLCLKNYWCKHRKPFIDLNDKLIINENTKKEKLMEEDEINIDPLHSKSKKEIKSDIYDKASKFESEQIYENKNPNEVFKIKNIVKIFSDGKKAVDKVSLRFYKDEIFALLGHNGAGKTTLISMLTGMYEATEGEAIYDGINILDSNNMDIFREKIGICPQHDTLFEDLNIREHLEMFSIFKGVKGDEVDNEVNKTLRDFQIENIQTMLARNLSAGQRRKLSIAISLIGGSQVIFLDEPSSGMDITSRRNLWEILKRQCDGKIIILTTHYMEEASVLGKRIGIINEGKMKCIGSPLFLIEKFGKFMSLNISKDEYSNNNQIVDFVKKLVKNVEYEILSEEIMFRIPVKDKRLKKCIDIPEFFQSLDENINNLKIKSYSVSMPTLEDVFLNVAAEDDRKKNEQKYKERQIEEENDGILYNSDLLEKYSSCSKFMNDFFICMKRRYLITKRDIKGFLMEILCPILLVLFGLLISKFEMNFKSKPYVVDLDLTGKQKIIFASTNKNKSKDYLESSKIISIEEIDLYDFSNINDLTDYPKITNLSNITSASLYRTYTAKNFFEKVYDITSKFEDSQFNEVDMTSEDYVGYYSSILMFSDKDYRYEFIMALNSRIRHCIPIYTHYILKSIIRKATKKDIKITYTHYPMPLTADLNEQNSIGNNLSIIFFIAIAFAIMPANFISLLVKERTNNSKHLMRLSGINILSYWLVNYIFEFLKYYVTAGACLLLLVIFNFYKQYLYILYLAYGPAMISLTYSMSFFFNDESNAQNAVILLNFVLGDLGSIVVLILRLLPSMKENAKIVEYILSLVPTFCFDFSFNLLLNRISIYQVEYNKEEWFNFKGDEMIKHPKLMLPLIICCFGECIIYTILFIIIESRSYVYKKPKNEILISKIKDEEVKKEIEKANSRAEILLPYNLDLSSENNESLLLEDLENKEEEKYENIAVRVKNLQKIYKNGCRCLNGKDNIAINNLHFCISPGECFGLLGLNGAGKTTTFKCITQEISPDNGQIFIFGREINGKFNELNKIFGYCPQFDAIFEYLTVYENLEFYARIKGVKKPLIHQYVTFMIKEMSLNEFTNKIAGRLSGGNKRKLSVAISMIGNPPIILLDEPSTGMDPEARRFMWSVIHKMSKKGRKSSVIMTTHSMDEAETLCKRMGIMVNGEFVCLGTANQIKSKYGYGYEADVRIKPMTIEQQKEILNKYKLDHDLKVDHSNLKEVLNNLKKENYYEEMRPGRLGERIRKAININEKINIGLLLNWLFFVENALKFIAKGKKYFQRIILSEHIENNFLFKLKKRNDTKSIGFFFGLFEESKEECYVTEYSIQQTSLEQIFNKFAINQGKNLEEFDEDDLLKLENKNIDIDDNLLNNLIIK